MSALERTNGKTSAVDAVGTTDTPTVDVAKTKGETKTTQARKFEAGKGKKNGKFKRDFKANVKTDFGSLPESEDPDEIRQQVEFYFSDSNLMTDKYLFNLVGGKNNNWVDIKILHEFKRMKHFQPFSAVVEALKHSEKLEVNDKDQIRRKTALPAEVGATFEGSRDAARRYEELVLARSIYAKGFGDEEPSTQFDIEAFFAPYGPVNAVRLRRTQDKFFKGSVFVEFDNEETQKAFLALDPKPKYQGRDLIIKTKQTYDNESREELRNARNKPTRHRHPRRVGHEGRAGRGDKYTGQGRRNDASDDDQDWKDRRNDFQNSKEFIETQSGGDNDGPEDSKKRTRPEDDDDSHDGASPKKTKV